MTNKVAFKYAYSFLDLSLEQGILDLVAKDIDLIINVFNANLNLKRIFENPIIKTKDKIEILQKIFEQKISNETLKFINFLGKKGRESFLFEICKIFSELKDARLGLAKVELISAADLSENQINQLKEKIEMILNKKIIFDIKVDNSILGGFIAKSGDTIIDASLKHQLELLRKQFLAGGASLN